MAPISPISRKRSTPSDSGSPEEPAMKKLRIEPVLPRTPPPEEDLLRADLTKTPMFNDSPQELLSRSVATILEHVGFSGASREALEALCSEVDAYATHFLSQITAPMQLSRRNETLPLDFEYAFHKFLLPTASIEPHLKPPVTPPKPQDVEDPQPEDGKNTASLAKLLGDGLSGESDKLSKGYVPGHFPSFPSKHTYKWTEKESARETDPRKIREEAAKSSRQAEEALRRLVKISKAGREKDVKRMAEKDRKSKLRHELWERTIESLTVRKQQGTSSSTQDDDRSMIVNSESQYYRKPVVKRRNLGPIQAEGEKIS